MDDYLSKPIDRIKLDACLERLLPSTGATGLLPVLKEAAPAPPAPLPARVDWDALLESIDGDTGFARELLGAFVGTADRELAAIAAALGTGDAASLRESAHTLKGTSANLRASAAAAAAAQLETAARTGQSAELSALADQLTNEVQGAIVYLRTKVG
jgi:HPt (histidine-containing phosphotransfer) domain-containing protein